jgi:asparagine synthase (glutamine-hydrolysing)
MPGICGLISRTAPAKAKAELLRMVEALRHEAFYTTGTWADESLGVYVGWAVRKDSFCDGMPFTNEDGSVTLVFSGEEYREPREIAALQDRGHKLQAGKASYLVHLYEEDSNFPLGLNGLFHGLVVDRKRGVATLFNDRYGMHRLCYHESNDGFYFAAEAKAILAVRHELRRADPRSLGEFVACSCVLRDRTIFKDINALPAASTWTFRNGSMQGKNTYFQPSEWETQAPVHGEAYYRELRDVFSKNLGLYFAGPERLAMTLTGGLDTRMVMAWHQSAPGSLPCYTFGGTYRDSEDVRLARRIAKLCQQPYEVITVGDGFLSRFPEYAERTVYLTEGGVDVYRASDLYVSEQARKIAPAKIVGTYGSEIIRQAVMFKAVMPPLELFRPEFLSYVRQAEDTYLELRREHPLTFAAFRQSPWYHQGVLALESTQLTVRSPYLDNGVVQTIFREPKLARLNGDIRLRLIRDGSPTLAAFRTDRGVGGSNRLASAFSRAYLEFTFKAEYAYDYGMPQWVSQVDHALAPLHLERLWLGRHKLSHFRVWYRDVLSEYVREILLDRRTLSRPYLQPKAVEAMVNGHTRQGLNYTSMIHKLLTLELLQRLFLDAE